MLLNVIKIIHNVVIDVRKKKIIINICLRIMELSDVYVNDNELEKFHQNYCRTHWPSKGMACEVKDCGSYPTLRKYIIGSTRSITTFWFVLAVPRFSRNYIFSPYIFRALSFRLFWKNFDKAEKNKDTVQPKTSMVARKLAEKRKRGIEVEKNMQSGGMFYWRKSAIQIREMRWSSLTRTTMLNSTLRITTTQRKTNS